MKTESTRLLRCLLFIALAVLFFLVPFTRAQTFSVVYY